MTHDPQFTVRIHFSELVKGDLRAYSHDMRVHAFDLQEAFTRAIGEFEALAAHSNVGWIRSVDGVEIRCDTKPVKPPPRAATD